MQGQKTKGNNNINSVISINMKYNIYKRIAGLSFVLSFLFSATYGQLSITDTGNCLNHTLHATIIGTTPTGSGISADDGYSGVFPLGFTFNFYGTNYTQCVIGSNGLISFDLTLAGAYCPWPITAALAGNPSARNAICGPWCDILISAGGSITYSTAGVAPNRRFAVTWCGTGMYSCTTQWTTSQIIIYETSNLVEVHTAHKTICAWNSGAAITGVQNTAGTSSTVAPGRDWSPSWSVTSPPEAWRFTPSGPSYTVASIPYAPMPYATSGIYWYDSTTGAYLGTGPFLTVSPLVPTTYMAAALGCNDTTKAYIHVLPASAGIGGIPHISGYTYTDPTECGKCDGTITLRGVNPHQIDTVFHSIGGVPQPPYVDSAALDSTIHLNNLCGGVVDWIYVKVANCPSNQVGPIVLTTPVLAISNVTYSDPTVCGYYDGWIKLFGLTPGKPVSVAFTKNGVAQPPVAGLVASDSTFVLTGLGAGLYSSFGATVGLCTAPWGPVNLANPPGISPTFTPDVRYGCTGDTVFVTNTTTPTGYFTYMTWDPSTSMALDSTKLWHIYNTQSNTPKWTGNYNLVMTYNTVQNHDPACARTDTVNVTIDHQLHAIFTPINDSVCSGDAVLFSNASTSALSATPTYYWNFGDGFVDDGTESPEHTYFDGQTYTATLTATDMLGCEDKVSHTIEVIELKVKTGITDTNVCLKTPMQLRVQAETFDPEYLPSVTYSWTQSPSGANLNAYNVQNPWFTGLGDYIFEVTASTPPFVGHPNGCTKVDTTIVHSHPPISLTNLTVSPQVVTLGNTLQLNAEGAVYYKWTPDNGTLNNPSISNPIVKPTDSTTVYTVQGMSLYGCLATAEIVVYVDQDVTQFVPSAFTPNGDGKNDVFRIVKLRFQKLVDFRIYNRWGEAVFQTANPEQAWDGTWKGVPQDMGTYMYEIIVALPNGLNKVYKGNVLLIR
jgi:gliding motility-associated-like protein